jgi:HK97 family phage major capsid protein
MSNMDEVIKSVRDLADEVKKAGERHQALPEQIMEGIKGLVASAPNPAPARSVEFATGVSSQERVESEIIGSMPKELRQNIDEMVVASKLLGKPVQNLKSWGEWKRRAGEFKKALDTATGAQGGDWVPTNFSNELFEFVQLEAKVPNLFRTIVMPSNPYKLPVGLSRISTFKHAEQTADTGQTKITVGDGSNVGNATLTAVGHAARVLTSTELDEDSIVPVLPWLVRGIAKSIAEGREDFILNGDSAGTHEDSDIGAGSADSRRRIALGLRAASNDGGATYKLDMGTFSLANLRALRVKLGKYGVNPADCAIITGPVGYAKLLGLTEVVTMQNFGNAATAITGSLGNVDGMPVFVSGFVREDLNVSNFYDGVTTTKTALYMVYRPGWVMGERRATNSVRVLNELYAESDQVALVAKERVTFKDIYPTASNKTIGVGYNIA